MSSLRILNRESQPRALDADLCVSERTLVFPVGSRAAARLNRNVAKERGCWLLRGSDCTSARAGLLAAPPFHNVKVLTVNLEQCLELWASSSKQVQRRFLQKQQM